MRELLFRGKREEDGEWVYGYYVFQKKRSGIFGQMVSDSDFDRSYIIDLWTGKPHIVDPATVGQYTGVRDKKKRAIFEGDIVSVTFVFSEESEISDIDETAEVIWSEEYTGWFLAFESGGESEMWRYDSHKLLEYGKDSTLGEVVGNIYDGYKKGEEDE